MKPGLHRAHQRGFTLLESILALTVFSLAVIGLVETINTMGAAAVESRQELMIQGRMETLLVEITRDPLWLKDGVLTPPQDRSFVEGAVTYKTKITPLELQNNKGEQLNEFYKATVQALWKEGRTDQEVIAETWVWPRLYSPAPR